MTFLWIILIIILAIIRINNGIQIFSNNGSFRRNYIDDMFDPLASYNSPEYRQIEQMNRIDDYFRNRDITYNLLNDFCECRLRNVGSSKTEYIIYCKEKYHGKNEGIYIDITGMSQNILTFWLLIQSIFNDNTRINDIKKLCRSQTYTLHIKSLNKNGYPDLITNETQNEICRLNLINNETNNQKYFIQCVEIWHSKNVKPRAFIIRGKEQSLRLLIKRFRIHHKLFADYDYLKNFYASKKNFIVEENGIIIQKETEKQDNINNEQNLQQKIDINNTTTEEIATLPKISVIMAKKLVKRRNEINGFTSIDEICEFLKLNDETKEQIQNLIEFQPIINTEIEKTNERQIDL